jgi:hypothetical protein
MFSIAELLAAILTLLGAAENSSGLVVANDDLLESSPDPDLIDGPFMTADALTNIKSISKS